MSHTACGCHAHAAKPAPNHKVVLVVDDDPDCLFQQKTWLEGEGFEVLTAEGETPAAKLLAEHQPDLAVVDLMMENPDGGFSLCHQMRKRFPKMPIILVSSVNSVTGMQFDAGTEGERSWIKADVFLAKPIRFEQLKFEIDRLLQG